MKYSILILLFALLNGSCKTKSQSDSVRIADTRNDEKAKQGVMNKDVADFLVQAADARMMDSKEAELALAKSKTDAVKTYAALMVKDQAVLMANIKQLAANRKIILPATISDDKKEGYDDLNSKEGKDFDEKFVKMMKIDHERDVKAFTGATSFTDKGVSDFAKKYLVMIQSHLDKVNELKDKIQ